MRMDATRIFPFLISLFFCLRRVHRDFTMQIRVTNTYTHSHACIAAHIDETPAKYHSPENDANDVSAANSVHFTWRFSQFLVEISMWNLYSFTTRSRCANILFAFSHIWCAMSFLVTEPSCTWHFSRLDPMRTLRNCHTTKNVFTSKKQHSTHETQENNTILFLCALLNRGSLLFDVESKLNIFFSKYRCFHWTENFAGENKMNRCKRENNNKERQKEKNWNDDTDNYNTRLTNTRRNERREEK